MWVIRNPARTLLVDTGFSADMAVRRGRRYLASPVDLLKQIGIAAESVEDIVVTHMHYDHAGNIAAFPKARLAGKGNGVLHGSLHVPRGDAQPLRGSGRGPGRRAAACRPAGVPRRRCRDRARRQPAPDRRAQRGLQVVRVATERGWLVRQRCRALLGQPARPPAVSPSCSTWAGCWTAIAASRNWRTGRSTSFPGMTRRCCAFRPCAARTDRGAAPASLDTYAERASRHGRRPAFRGSVGAWTWERT